MKTQIASYLSLPCRQYISHVPLIPPHCAPQRIQQRVHRLVYHRNGICPAKRWTKLNTQQPQTFIWRYSQDTLPLPCTHIDQVHWPVTDPERAIPSQSMQSRQQVPIPYRHRPLHQPPVTPSLHRITYRAQLCNINVDLHSLLKQHILRRGRPPPVREWQMSILPPQAQLTESIRSSAIPVRHYYVRRLPTLRAPCDRLVRRHATATEVVELRDQMR